MDSKLFCKAYEYVTVQLNDPDCQIFTETINFEKDQFWFQITDEFCSALGIVMRMGLPFVPNHMNGNSDSLLELVLYLKGVDREKKGVVINSSCFFPSLFGIDRHDVDTISHLHPWGGEFECEGTEHFALASREIKKVLLEDIDTHFGKLYKLLKSWE